MSEPLIERSEIVGLLFNVSDIAVALSKIYALLEGGEDDDQEADGS